MSGYLAAGPVASISGGNPNLVGKVGAMVNDFVYGPADGNSTLTLSGLTIGAQYTSTWYNRGWGNPGGRTMFITASDTPGGIYRVDENFTGDGNGNVIRYTFTANATTQTFAFDAANNPDSFHHYAFSNAVRNDAVVSIKNTPAAPRIVALSGAGSVTPPGVLNNDLLQTQVANVTTTGTFNGEGTGGLAALIDGTFTASSGGFNQFLTPEAGATITVDLNVSVNTLGYDISSIRGYGGWQDGGRDRQNYNLYYSLVGSSAFTLASTSITTSPTPARLRRSPASSTPRSPAWMPCASSSSPRRKTIGRATENSTSSASPPFPNPAAPCSSSAPPRSCSAAGGLKSERFGARRDDRGRAAKGSGRWSGGVNFENRLTWRQYNRSSRRCSEPRPQCRHYSSSFSSRGWQSGSSAGMHSSTRITTGREDHGGVG